MQTCHGGNRVQQSFTFHIHDAAFTRFITATAEQTAAAAKASVTEAKQGEG